jgi:type IV secretory pathway VirJ component
MGSRVWALLGLALVACARTPAPPETVDAGRLGRVLLFASADPPTSLVYLFTDSGGWAPPWDRVARKLAKRGAAVIGVDLPIYLANLRASNDGCHYLISEIEGLSKQVQEQLGSEEYHSPILAGVGEGGTLTYAALAQSPAVTVAGAVSVDPTPALDTRVPLCPGAPSHPAHKGGFSYGPKSDLPGFWRVSTRVPLAPPLAALARAEGTATHAVSGDPLERLLGLVEIALVQSQGGEQVLRDLPLVEIPVAHHGPWMAVIYSGDGGWRDLDKTIGEDLARHGIPVVGVDSLRYFWRKKTPEKVAADLAAIIQHYGEKWGTTKVGLVGYSFGAGVIPFAVNRLPAAERARVVQISLLGVEPKAPFEFKVTGWLDQVGVELDPYQDAPPVLPELQRLDPKLVQCFYGADETDSVCPDPSLGPIERIETGGGHHFGGDYAVLARRILDGMHHRAPAGAARARAER